MIIVDHRTTKCSKCDSGEFESVTQGNARFMRCRKCGHEGQKSNIAPEPHGAGGMMKYTADQPLKF